MFELSTGKYNRFPLPMQCFPEGKIIFAKDFSTSGTMYMWNLWHGCHKVSEGCRHCYVYRRDSSVGVDSTVVHKTGSFRLPLSKSRSGQWKIPPGSTVFTCFTSDFFIEDADQWREDAWKMIRFRKDLHFFMVTKRPERILQCIPSDWGEGYPNVTLCCTMENQPMADRRLPVFMEIPALHKEIICEPLLGKIDFHGKLSPSWCEEITVGGESGPDARVCDYDWVLDIRRQCMEAAVDFHFKQTGALFRKDGRLYRIDRKFQISQAGKASIDIHISVERPSRQDFPEQ